MASKARNWLIGCGLGCGAVLLIVVALAVGATAWFGSKFKGFGEAVEVRERLEQRVGAGDEFVPWADGVIPADRMETFLAIREATQPHREQIAGFFEMFPEEEELEQLESSSTLEKLRFGLRMGRSGMGLAGYVADFFQARNQGLSDGEMGLGEYTYIYVTAYYAWLGHSPGDDPEDVVDERPTVIGDDAPANRGSWQTERARDDYVAQLENLHGSLAGPETDDWAEQLAGEIAALGDDDRRVPWPEGVPEPIVASLEPYQERLEATYRVATNPFELSRAERRGLSIQAD